MGDWKNICEILWFEVLLDLTTTNNDWFDIKRQLQKT